MRARYLSVCLVFCAGPAMSEPLADGGADCGGDAMSSARVIERRPPRRGPLTAVPETLCADLVSRQPPIPVDIDTHPVLLPEIGAGRRPAPYDAWPYRDGPPRPSRP